MASRRATQQVKQSVIARSGAVGATRSTIISTGDKDSLIQQHRPQQPHPQFTLKAAEHSYTWGRRGVVWWGAGVKAHHRRGQDAGVKHWHLQQLRAVAAAVDPSDTHRCCTSCTRDDLQDYDPFDDGGFCRCVWWVCGGWVSVCTRQVLCCKLVEGGGASCPQANTDSNPFPFLLCLPLPLLLLPPSTTTATTRSRFWLFLSYVVSFASVVGAVWVLMQHYGEQQREGDNSGGFGGGGDEAEAWAVVCVCTVCICLHGCAIADADAVFAAVTAAMCVCARVFLSSCLSPCLCLPVSQHTPQP